MLEFWNALQSADYETRLRWAMVFTALSVVIVVFVWLMYFNNLVPSAGRTASRQSAAENKLSSLTIVKGGPALVYETLRGALRGVIGWFAGPKDYIVEPKE